MRLLADGKTKTLYELENGHLKMVFKDDVTGTEEGVDPGGNFVVGKVAGKGLAAVQQSAYFFELLAAHGVPTHFVAADVDAQALVVKRATWNGLEFIVRFKAAGSFVRRYGRYIEEGAELGGLVEITLKDDERGDPLIVDEAIEALGIMRIDDVRAKAPLRKRRKSFATNCSPKVSNSLTLNLNAARWATNWRLSMTSRQTICAWLASVNR